MYWSIAILILVLYIIYLLRRKVMPAQDALAAAVDSLVNSVQAEIRRVTLDLSNAKATDSQGIQDAIGKLNNLVTQLDAVDPAVVATGVVPVLEPAPTTESNPIVETSVASTPTATPTDLASSPTAPSSGTF
jgi:hypothetical protein